MFFVNAPACIRYTTRPPMLLFFFFFNDTATTEIYTLSLHDALPICNQRVGPMNLIDINVIGSQPAQGILNFAQDAGTAGIARYSSTLPLKSGLGGDKHLRDRKSTRLNSSHANISYAVFCLKKNTTHATPECCCFWTHGVKVPIAAIQRSHTLVASTRHTGSHPLNSLPMAAPAVDNEVCLLT